MIKVTPYLNKVELQVKGVHKDIIELAIGADGIHLEVAKLLSINDNAPPI